MVDEQYCRVCGGDLKVVLDLGEIYPSSFLREDDKLTEDMKAPLTLAECEHCGLIQLKHTVDLDLMYRQYWYSSSLNKSMVSSLKEIVCEIEDRVKLKKGDVVLDIGCNDGTMLELYSQEGIYRVGFDPSLNLNRKEFPLFMFMNEYFDADLYPSALGKAKVITAIAMFYDLPNPNRFLKDVKSILHDNGIFVVQFTDLVSMFKATAFDNICHEHLEYYRLYDIHKLFDTNGLQIIDVSYNDVNGGSLRVTACHKENTGYSINIRVLDALLNEEDFLSKYSIEHFKQQINVIRATVKEFLHWSKECDCHMTTYLLGASTKGNTLLQICGITNEDIPYAAEVNKDKFGLRTGGSNIKVISEDEAFENKPDIFFVPIWHFKNNILNNPKIKNFIDEGGAVVFPLPYFHIIRKEDLEND